jgi:hypothetical protein
MSTVGKGNSRTRPADLGDTPRIAGSVYGCTY